MSSCNKSDHFGKPTSSTLEVITSENGGGGFFLDETPSNGSCHEESAREYSGGGFFAEDDEAIPSLSASSNCAESSSKAAESSSQPTELDADIDRFKPKFGGFLNDDLPTCVKCREKFPTSFLWDYFEYPICDICRSKNKEEHDLITRTQAKEEYLLKDFDLDRREPPLHSYAKKNPHNPRGHDMKLYLHLQVKKRALEIWGDFETLETELEKRTVNRMKIRGRNFDKRVKAARQATRKPPDIKPKIHEHDFAEEQFDADSECFFKVCKTCQQKLTYEKL